MFTLVHVVISILGIITGLVAVDGLMAGARRDGVTTAFLITTVLTNVTAFGFPFTTVLPSHVVAAISLVLLAVCLVARYVKGLQGAWRRIFVIPADLGRRRRHPLRPTQLAHHDLLLVGGDLVGEEAVRPDAQSLEQSRAGPVQRLADFVMRIGLAIQAHDAQTLVAQEHAGRQARETRADHSHVVARRIRHVWRVIRAMGHGVEHWRATENGRPAMGKIDRGMVVRTW